MEKAAARQTLRASQVVLVVKSPPASAGDLRDMGLIPGKGRSPGGGNGIPLLKPGRLQPMGSQRDRHLEEAESQASFLHQTYSTVQWFKIGGRGVGSLKTILKLIFFSS